MHVRSGSRGAATCREVCAGVSGTAWGACIRSASWGGSLSFSASVSPSARARGFQALLGVLDARQEQSSAPREEPRFMDDRTETEEGQ